MKMINFTHDSDQCDDFSFPIVNFPYLSRYIQKYPACGVFVSHLIRYTQVFDIYRFSVQRIYSNFKITETGIFLNETSDYF